MFLLLMDIQNGVSTNRQDWSYSWKVKWGTQSETSGVDRITKHERDWRKSYDGKRIKYWKSQNTLRDIQILLHLSDFYNRVSRKPIQIGKKNINFNRK